MARDCCCLRESREERASGRGEELRCAGNARRNSDEIRRPRMFARVELKRKQCGDTDREIREILP